MGFANIFSKTHKFSIMYTRIQLNLILFHQIEASYILKLKIKCS
jgi:hypothetical protein